jgi:amino acid adenylation domain-containing protein
MDTNAILDTSRLSGDDLELLAYLLEEEGVELSERQTIFPRTQHDHLPLSFAQSRLWFMDQLEPGIAAYNLPFAIRVTGRLAIAVLRQSLNAIVQRHEVLRTTFPTVDGQAIQAILPTLKLHIPVIDLQSLSASEQEAEIYRQVGREAQRAFDLAHGPLLVAKLLRLAENEHVVLLTIHHIVFDGWSMGLFLQEVMALYDAFSNGQPAPLPALPIQYADFALWQRQWLQGEVEAKQLAYWRDQFSARSDGREAVPVLELPTDRPRPPRQTYGGAHSFRTLPPALVTALNELSQGEGATLFMTLLATFNVLLYRYSGQDDIVVGSPIANRDFLEIEHLMGFFVNTLLLRTDLAGAPSFRTLLERVRELTFAAYAHQNIPFERLVDELQPERNLSHHPLFQVMFIYQNAPMPAYERADLQMQFLRIENGIAKFDLVLAMTETPDALNTVFEYNTLLFDTPTIYRMQHHYQTLLETIVADPDQPITQLSLLGAAERQQLFVEWNDTARPYPATCPHQWFAAQADRSPDATAVILPAASSRHGVAEHLTYGTLNARANQLAHALQAYGVGPEVRVGLCVERSLDMIVGMFGILKAGGAYVPLDPAYPTDRLTFMLEDSQVPLLLTRHSIDDGRFTTGDLAESDTTIGNRQFKIINLDSDWPLIAQRPTTNPPTRVTPDHLAYLIYTSGSTGRPKGTMITQRSISNFISSTTALFAVTPADHILQFASFCFDVSVFEIFTALLSGATLCLTDLDTLLSPAALTTLMQTYCISVIDVAPAVMALLPGDAFPDLRIMFVGGEAFTGELVNRWALPGRHFYNGYGPTEATVSMTEMECVGQYDHTPPIGRPMGNHQTYILDQHWRPVPIGVAGQLYIGGTGLARGYLHRPDLTAEKFIPNPFCNGRWPMADGRLTQSTIDHRPFAMGTRLYASGDLARYRPDGNIEFLGRTDHQIKIRGFRVELGEIETVLRAHAAVRDIAVVALEAAPGEKRLVAYVVPTLAEAGAPAAAVAASAPAATALPPLSSIQELRRWAQARLPEYMIPAALVLLDTLPLTASGKIDRRALPAPDWSQRLLDADYIAPSTPVEQVVADLVAQMLGLPRVGIRDNFFALGVHSLLATRLVVRLCDIFAIKLPLRSLFEAPTVAGLAERIETLQWVTKGAELSADAADDGYEKGAI